MKIIVTRQFEKDVNKQLDIRLQLQLADVVENIKRANSLRDIVGLKKLKGFKTAYRIRMGEYRIGFIYEDDSVKLSRIMNRKEIYKFFP